MMYAVDLSVTYVDRSSLCRGFNQLAITDGELRNQGVSPSVTSSLLYPTVCNPSPGAWSHSSKVPLVHSLSRALICLWPYTRDHMDEFHLPGFQVWDTWPLSVNLRLIWSTLRIKVPSRAFHAQLMNNAGEWYNSQWKTSDWRDNLSDGVCHSNNEEFITYYKHL